MAAAPLNSLTPSFPLPPEPVPVPLHERLPPREPGTRPPRRPKPEEALPVAAIALPNTTDAHGLMVALEGAVGAGAAEPGGLAVDAETSLSLPSGKGEAAPAEGEPAAVKGEVGRTPASVPAADSPSAVSLRSPATAEAPTAQAPAPTSQATPAQEGVRQEPSLEMALLQGRMAAERLGEGGAKAPPAPTHDGVRLVRSPPVEGLARTPTTLTVPFTSWSGTEHAVVATQLPGGRQWTLDPRSEAVRAALEGQRGAEVSWHLVDADPSQDRRHRQPPTEPEGDE